MLHLQLHLVKRSCKALLRLSGAVSRSSALRLRSGRSVTSHYSRGATRSRTIPSAACTRCRSPSRIQRPNGGPSPSAHARSRHHPPPSLRPRMHRRHRPRRHDGARMRKPHPCRRRMHARPGRHPRRPRRTHGGSAAHRGPQISRRTHSWRKRLTAACRTCAAAAACASAPPQRAGGRI